jgi:glycosyltransferase involved in cell wall biosynthesis
MKILHCIHLEIPGGKETHLYRCLKFGLEKGDLWEHDILHTGDRINEKFGTFFKDHFHVYEYKTWRGIKIPKFLRSYLVKKNIDFSHDVNLFYEIQDLSLMNLFATYAKGENVFYDRGHSWFLNAEESQYLSKFDFFFSNSRASKTMLNKRWSVPEDRIKVIHNSLPLDYLEHTDRIGDSELAELRKRFNLNGKKVILFLGRLETIKGAHTLIESLNYLPGKDKKLILVGDGKIRKTLEALVKAKKEEDRVIFAGMQTGTAIFYKMADVTVVPSAREPFGNVNLEAALAGSPLIASKIDGIPEIITDDSFGYLLKPKIEPSSYSYLDESSMPDYVVDPDTMELMKPKFLDPKELADTIALVLEREPEAAKERAKNLKQRVIKEFSMGKREQRFRELIEEITRHKY